MDHDADEQPRTLLITLTGRDRPGVTATLTGALAAHDLEILDVEQVVIRGRLTLGVLVGPTVEHGSALVLDAAAASAREVAVSLEMDADVVLGAAEHVPGRRGRLLVTVIGHPLLPSALSGITRRISALGGNIDRIVRTAAYPVTAIELSVSGADQQELREALAVESAALGVDAAVQRRGLRGRGTYLVVMDVDSTLIQDEVIELIAAEAGCLDEVRAVTERAMSGELDFTAALTERVARLKGLEVDALDRARARMRLTPGARTFVRTLKRLGYTVGIVSGGFTHFTDGLAAELGLDHARANQLEVHDGRLTGRVLGEVVDRGAKARFLRSFAEAEGIPLSQTVAVGDGANDLDMLATAGLGVAFNAKPVVQEAADTTVNVPYLDAILFVLGVTRDEVERADTDTG